MRTDKKIKNVKTVVPITVSISPEVIEQIRKVSYKLSLSLGRKISVSKLVENAIVQSLKKGKYLV
jgi:hypothetical protein